MKRLILFAASALVAANLLAGHMYHFQMVTSAPDGDRTTSGTVVAVGGLARIEFDTDENIVLPRDSVVISKNGGTTLIVIDPRHKLYQEVDLGAFFDPAAAARKKRVSATNPKVEIRDDGDGGEIDGFPTHKYTIHSSYDTALSHIAMRSEVWATGKLPAELTTFLQFRGLRTGIEEIDKELAAHPIQGFPLRQLITSRMTSSSRDVKVWTTTITVTGVQERTVPASKFEIPAGYTKGEW
jgi:hypothetical protein